MKLRLRNLDTVAPIVTCLALFVLFSLITDKFLSRENLFNILSQNSALAIMAVGITFVLLTGEIDLSIEGMAVFAGVLTAWLFNVLLEVSPNTPAFLTQLIPVAVTVLVAACVGIFAGLGVATLRVPSFMMTLSLGLIATGLALRITRGSPIFNVPGALEFIGNRSLRLFTYVDAQGHSRALVELPWVTVLAAAFLAVAYIGLRYTRFGRNVYAVGGNRVAAELSGINVTRTLVACFCICSVTAAVGGIVFIGRFGSAQAGGLDQVLIQCVSAVVIGGTSLFGGKGGIGNTIIGVLTFGILHNGLNHVEVDTYLKGSIMGAILLAALVLNVSLARIRRA